MLITINGKTNQIKNMIVDFFAIFQCNIYRNLDVGVIKPFDPRTELCNRFGDQSKYEQQHSQGHQYTHGYPPTTTKWDGNKLISIGGD